MKRRALLLASLALMLTAACHATDPSATGTIPEGAMRYTAFDESGRLVVRGWIRVDIPGGAVASGVSVTGEWELHALVDPGLVGGQDGHGTLEGELQNGHLTVSLFPGMADGGCDLDGALTNGAGAGSGMAYSGTWSDQTIAGPRHHGTFQAQR